LVSLSFHHILIVIDASINNLAKDKTKESIDIEKRSKKNKNEKTLHAFIIVRELICRVLSLTIEEKNTSRDQK